MNYDYGCNAELKRLLRQYGITYKDIAIQAKYSVQTIKAWMRSALTPERRETINNAMEQIREERRLSYED